MSGQQAVSAYFHFQAWRYKIEARPVGETLRQLRNSLIHLDEAQLGSFGARSLYDEKGKPSKAWAIDKLPDGTLPLVFHASFVESIFGLIDLRSMYDDVAPCQSFQTDNPWEEFD